MSTAPPQADEITSFIIEAQNILASQGIEISFGAEPDKRSRVLISGGVACRLAKSASREYTIHLVSPKIEVVLIRRSKRKYLIPMDIALGIYILLNAGTSRIRHRSSKSFMQEMSRYIAASFSNTGTRMTSGDNRILLVHDKFQAALQCSMIGNKVNVYSVGDNVFTVLSERKFLAPRTAATLVYMFFGRIVG